MSALTDFYATIRAWVDDVNPNDALIDSWLRIAEERLNNELRSQPQVVRDQATFDDQCAVLPPDWLEHIYVRVKGGLPFHYVTPDAYWHMAANTTAPLQIVDPTNSAPLFACGGDMVYTTIGDTLFILPKIDPNALTKIEIGYYRKIRPLQGDDKDEVHTRYPSILLNCTLSAGAPYLIEDDRLNTFATLATAGIVKANESTDKGRWSGSPLTMRTRSFG